MSSAVAGRSLLVTTRARREPMRRVVVGMSDGQASSTTPNAVLPLAPLPGGGETYGGDGRGA